MQAHIELIPSLDHCIETTARQEFSRSRDEYLQTGVEDRELEGRIELLRLFLEEADFRQLRRESEQHLTGGKTVRCVLNMEDGKLKYEMKVE